ncbi:MAG: hypothetical protein LQ344_001134 [Seirophora lacunosa]|nr:MAG: hypothetical protein LQ344_001134 [Seirophora lacunosa]
MMKLSILSKISNRTNHPAEAEAVVHNEVGATGDVDLLDVEEDVVEAEVEEAENRQPLEQQKLGRRPWETTCEDMRTRAQRHRLWREMRRFSASVEENAAFFCS